MIFYHVLDDQRKCGPARRFVGMDDPGGARCTRRQARVARLSRLCRPRGGGLDRLYGSGKFCDKYPGWRQIRIWAPLGGVAREPDRDAVSGAFGQTRDRYRSQSCRTLPRTVFAPGRLGDVGRQRDRRDGDRSRRVSRRCDRIVAAVQDPAARRHADHRDRGLWYPIGPTKRLPADRADHRQSRRDDQPLLPDRDVHSTGRLGCCGLALGRAATCRSRGAGARGRHYRRHRHAARGLSAFRADPSAHPSAPCGR